MVDVNKYLAILQLVAVCINMEECSCGLCLNLCKHMKIYVNVQCCFLSEDFSNDRLLRSF